MIKENKHFIVSLYDYTGAWAKPYADNGYGVMLWDKKVEGCILERFDSLRSNIEEAIDAGYKLYGFLAAPPCTDFSVSGACWWPKKDIILPDDVWSSTDYHIAYVSIIDHLIDLFQPKFWAIENPVGRIEKLCQWLKNYPNKYSFHPCDFGDPYTKKTILWGKFNDNLIKSPVKPEFVEYKKKDGSVTRFAPQFGRTGGKSEKTKTIRSATPKGFANAFYQANNLQGQLNLIAA